MKIALMIIGTGIVLTVLYRGLMAIFDKTADSRQSITEEETQNHEPDA